MRVVLQVLIDQVSKQQSTIEEVVSRVTSLEGVSKKQQMLLKHFTSKVYKQKEDAFDGSDIKSILQAQKSSKKKSKKVVVGGAEKLKSSKKKMAAVTSEKLHKKKKPAKKEKATKDSPRKKKRDKLLLKAKVSSPSSSKPVLVKGEVEPPTTTPAKTPRTRNTKTPTTPGTKAPTTPGEKAPTTPGATPTIPTCIKAPTATPVRAHCNALPSSEINRSNLISVEEVLFKYQKYVLSGKIRVIARKLSREAVIGLSVMKRCTPRGLSHYPALPTDSLYSIKQILLKTFPQFWDKPVEFESEWLKCVECIERVCSDLRRIDSGFRRNPVDKSMKPIPLDLLTSGVAPAVISVVGIRKPLPSYEIDKSELVSVQKFMSLNSAAISQGEFNLGQLTCKLATECILGRKLMIKCTPYGRSTYPGFPVAEFNLLKQLVLDCNPPLWNMMEEFERRWDKVCRRSLVKLCSNMRSAIKLS